MKKSLLLLFTMIMVFSFNLNALASSQSTESTTLQKSEKLKKIEEMYGVSQEVLENLDDETLNTMFYTDADPEEVVTKVARLTAALVDRVIHHAHILTFTGDSYRVTHAF